MNQLTVSQLRDLADQLSLLANAFQVKPFHLRAKQIRQADKALISADAVFTPALQLEAKQWKEAMVGLRVLGQKLEALDAKHRELRDIEEQIAQLKSSTRAWVILEDSERQSIIQNAQKAQAFITGQNDQTEAHILHRYNRFSALKDLVSYADNASYLCEAISHHENRSKYEAHIVKTEEKIALSQERLKTIRRGIGLALVLCVFLVTLPICIPILASLWKRKREVEMQMENSQEVLKRENKRLKSSLEGEIIATEIKKNLGDISLEQIRNTLTEVRELRSEFHGAERTASSTAALLSFLELNRAKLANLFGPVPENPLESFRWLAQKVSEFQEAEARIFRLEERHNAFSSLQKQIVKGYSREVLLTSMEKLHMIVEAKLDFPFERENKSFFAELCLNIPAILHQMREALYYVSRNHAVDINYWNYLKTQILSFSNTLSLCVLDSEILLRQPNVIEAHVHTMVPMVANEIL